jgi:hypothetical protein
VGFHTHDQSFGSVQQRQKQKGEHLVYGQEVYAYIHASEARRSNYKWVGALTDRDPGTARLALAATNNARKQGIVTICRTFASSRVGKPVA